jgi:hypothetical protein
VAMVVFPIDPFLVGSDVEQVGLDADKFAQGLTVWRPATGETGITQPPRVQIEANGYEAALEKMHRVFLASNWGDGLPLNPPTAERVDWMLNGSDLPRDHIVGKVMPRGGIATVETLAVSLVMAGGRPEYLPVLIAAVAGILDPGLEHDKFQTTSASNFPVVIVNGPIAADIRLNSGFGLLGPDPQHPAGVVIGRALRLVQQNVGGALPGTGTMSIFGANRTTNMIFAEDEEGLPEGWPSVGEEHADVPRGANAVTVFVGTGATNIVRRGVGRETPEEEAVQSLRRIASYLRNDCIHYIPSHAEGTPGALLLSRVVARQFADLGWTKQTVKSFLWEHSKLSHAEIVESGMRQWIETALDPRTVASADDDPWPITRESSQIILAVAGGAHPTHNLWVQGSAPKFASVTIDLPKGWDALIAAAEDELGPSGEMCQI